ncbi:MAG: prolyl-tRNA synthetase associated domain-containing protein [Pseudomonadota bacterium]
MTDASDPTIPALPDPLEAEAALLARLEALGVGCDLQRHPPLFTVEDSRALRGALPGAHCKNLFLKEKKRGFWLVTCEERRAVRMKDLARACGARSFSFAGEADLAARLGVRPGAVTPLAVLNDPERQVRLAIDAQLFAERIINCHPLHNEATVAISTRDLRRVFAETGHEALEIDFDALEAQARA